MNGVYTCNHNLMQCMPVSIASLPHSLSVMVMATSCATNKECHLLCMPSTTVIARWLLLLWRDVNTHIDHFTAAALDDTHTLTRALHHMPALVHAWSGAGFHLLGFACFFAATACVRICIAHGADVNRPSQNAFAVAPIHSATAANNIVICQLLLDARADVNQPQQQNFRAMHNAAQHGNRALCALLIAHGADITAQTDAGQTAAMIAHAHNHTQLDDLLC